MPLRGDDSWEDWEDEVELKLPATAPAAAAAKDVDESKFAGEDEGEDEPKWKAAVPKPEQVSWPEASPVQFSLSIDTLSEWPGCGLGQSGMN